MGTNKHSTTTDPTQEAAIYITRTSTTSMVSLTFSTGSKHFSAFLRSPIKNHSIRHMIVVENHGLFLWRARNKCWRLLLSTITLTYNSIAFLASALKFGLDCCRQQQQGRQRQRQLTPRSPQDTISINRADRSCATADDTLFFQLGINKVISI